MVNYYAILLDGWNKPGMPVGANWSFPSNRVLLITDGYFHLGLGPLAVFLDGSLLIRQSFSEDYLIDGTTTMIRLPWTENYEVEKTSKTGKEVILLRQSFSENYLGDEIEYNRIGNSEDYQTEDLLFTRQPFSENYRVSRR